jgi:glycyl-tRNA synthetase beta chain
MVTGPPKKAAFDAAGKPTKAAEGFARSQGVAVDQLVTINTERGEYLAADRLEEGRPATAVLPELLTRLASTLPFAKQMRWGDGDVRFSRPVRWVVALLDDAVLPVAVAGVASDRITFGHRFLAPTSTRRSWKRPAPWSTSTAVAPWCGTPSNPRRRRSDTARRSMRTRSSR